MTEQVQEQEAVVEIDVETLKNELAEAKKSIEALVNKKEELLKETKAAKEEKRRKAEEALQAAEKNGEYERLYKQMIEEKESLAKQLEQDRRDRRDEKINLEAIRIANELAKGDAYKAELLSNFVAKSISNVADEFGRIDANVLKDVRRQFEADKKYAPLLGGNLAVGGSASGNTRGASVDNKTITREEFEGMNHAARMNFFKQGGKLSN